MARGIEDGHQEVIFKWASMQLGVYPELDLMYHVPNGGKRNVVEATKLKRMGVKAGVPDIVLPVARNGFHGLYVELKVGKNKTSENQDKWLSKLEEQGYKTIVCYGADNAIETIKDYLKS